MNRILTREERWWIFKIKHEDNGWTVPWDRMAYPTHEWFDNYIKAYNTNIDIYIPRLTTECTEKEIGIVFQLRTQDIPVIKKHIRGPIDKILIYKQYRKIQRKRRKRKTNRVRTIMYLENLHKVNRLRRQNKR